MSSSSSSMSPSIECPPMNEASALLVQALRPNEHLAVLMPRTLWKHDSLSSTCDMFNCSTPFTLFERRHHCRKCGGVYCAACTTHTTPLLDTRDLPFLHPPRNTPISAFGQPVLSRVCDDCWDQLWGCPSTPRTPESLRLSVTLPVARTGPPSSVSGDSSPASSSSPRTPPDVLLGLSGMSIGRQRKQSTSSEPPTRRSSVVSRASNPDLRRRATLAAQAAQSQSQTLIVSNDVVLPQGELATYPLCRSSSLCKASGGGRWVPRPISEDIRIFDHNTKSSTLGVGKAMWEVEWERDLRRERRRKENPIIRDGEFCYRVFRGSAHSDDGNLDLSEEVERKGGLARSFSLSTF